MNPKNFYTSLSRPARIGLLTGAGMIVLLTAVSLWWLMKPRQQLLFGNLREPAAAEIVQSLNEWKVPYEIVDGGASITVPSDVVYETRMKLVSAGVPRGGHIGFELFDDSDFGITEFAQRVNYQRALQGEIERTIAALPGVETARVHLTIRRPGLFVGEKEASKASVAVTLLPGESLSRQQVNGIRSLVASAVEGLGTEAVSVLDSDGALLAGASGASPGASLDERDDEEGRLDARIQSRVSALLGQVLRDEEFRVSVDATLNFDTVREVNERPLAQGDGGNTLLVRKRVNSSDAADSNGRSQN
ncbi:MAG: flagellar basal-body MS-ring/collar protein FliF, partial [Lysobacter sp.]